MRILRAGLLVGLALAAGVAQARPEKKVEPSFRTDGQIHGYLVNPAGEGLTGIVSLCTEDGRKVSQYVSNSYRRGRFDMDNLQPGTYRLHVDTVGAVVTDIQPPADVTVTVHGGQVIRPHLVAR